ncbi:cytidylyltransferase domain-containing protein [Desulfogranum marinum]|uniref:cytidylyltransferase domain-containing protein n=1 Tax=Desulfogranum marinum TaxID=453220 RepID=UPI0029C68739|nr:glycosyltransferase [Desulfogranum marinum]
MKILIIIPARGGSKGIPRKNLRSLAGKPLIYYSIKTAIASTYSPDVYVSSEDEEIVTIAKKLGANVHRRNPQISKDSTTLDPVIYQAYCDISESVRTKYELIITLQATSPLLRTHTLDKAIEMIAANAGIDTVIAARDDTHLTWTKESGRYLPNYKERVNRQFLKPTFRETGAFLISRSSVISENNRIGDNVELFLLDGGEEIDIDTFEDWNLCEYFLRRKKILFVVSGYHEVGLGHVYNTLLVANDILDHQINFLVDKKSGLAKEKISLRNYDVQIQKNDELLEDVLDINPDIVINDILDTTPEYIRGLKNAGIRVVNFEDLGEGAKYADLVINAIYPEDVALPNHYFGADYFVLRDEFVLTPQKYVQPLVKDVLLTFGGVDPNNFTEKVLKSLHSYCLKNNIRINIITGFGYTQYQSLAPFETVTIYKDTSRISDLMSAADLIFTSAGRTVYEVAALGVPAIVLAQNEREMTHFFASEQNGFVHLGLGTNLSGDSILEAFRSLAESFCRREQMVAAMRKIGLRSGRQRVQRLIKKELEEI